ncbi:unnamed protein product [Xylocopa violacea]|uniref:Uncharacterized protein n=1 Tax=Xylocopa violacea TaxID=135666 RepID=A0ABP1N0S5_XYLVO
MVEVLERRAREPTGPIKAPRTYPGQPGSPVNRVLARLQPRQRLRLSAVSRDDDLLTWRLPALLTDSYSPWLPADVGEPRAGSSRQQPPSKRPIGEAARAADPFLARRLEIEVVARGTTGGGYRGHGQDVDGDIVGVGSDFERGGGERDEASESDRLRIEECVVDKNTSGEDKWWWEKVVLLVKRGVVPGRLEDRLEPRKGSLTRSETGERNVAKRRHGRPCGQQSMDEINGHCPQGEEASRFGLCRCRRFRCSGFCDYRQQRAGAQSSTSSIAIIVSRRRDRGKNS